jgi:hypothetical protein
MVYTSRISIGRVGWRDPGVRPDRRRQKDPVWVVPKSVRDEHAGMGTYCLPRYLPVPTRR